MVRVPPRPAPRMRGLPTDRLSDHSKTGVTLGGFSDSLSILLAVKNTFLDKLLNRIDRVGQGDLQAYLQRLNNEKGFFETIFNTLQEGIVVVDAKGKIRYLTH